MSNLINLINQHALSAAQAGNWQAVADTLNALTTEVRDNTLRTGRWLMLQLPNVVNQQTGMTESDIVLGTLQQSTIPRVKAAYDSLVNGGIDLSEDQVQQMIPVLAQAAGWPAGLADKILQSGRKNVSVLETATTAEACQKAWIVDGCRTAINALAAKVTAVNAWLDALDLSTKTVQELQAYCDALLASEDGNP